VVRILQDDLTYADTMQGKLIRTLSEHAHWVNTMALSTDYILRTGAFDPTAKAPKDDEEGELSGSAHFIPRYGTDFH
jgi:hypothetical protein